VQEIITHASIMRQKRPIRSDAQIYCAFGTYEKDLPSVAVSGLELMKCPAGYCCLKWP